MDTLPITSSNFADLAKTGFYDGLTFHRVINNFMCQVCRCHRFPLHTVVSSAHSLPLAVWLPEQQGSLLAPCRHGRPALRLHLHHA